MTQRCSFKSLLREGLVWKAEASPVLPNFPLKGEQRGQRAHFGIPEIDELLPQRGLGFNAIHELFPLGDSLSPCFLLASLASNTSASNRLIVWIGREVWPTPHLLAAQAPPILAQSIFIDPPTKKYALWAFETSLSSPAVAVAITHQSNLSLKTTRRLSLAAKKGSTLGIIVRPSTELHSLSAAATRWGVSPYPTTTFNPCWKLELIKCKGSSTPHTSWVIEWNHDEKVSLRLSPEMVSESPEKETRRRRYG